VDRSIFWFNILKSVFGVSIKTELGLVFSAPIDLFLHILGSQLFAIPRIYVSGIVYLRRYDVYFFVRAFSDDIYSIMPRREGDVNDIIISHLKHGDKFVDVGANIGYYSILAGKIIGEKGQVISIEPVPSSAKILEYNTKLNNLRNVKIIQKVAGEGNTSKTIYTPKGFFGLSSVQNLLYSDSCIVDGVTLDTFHNISDVKILKIDAEGLEYEILQGAKKLLGNTKHVILEASSRKNEIFDLLEKEGFKIQKMKFTTYVFAYK
jgi:FkbM family methyltransferase